MAAVLCESISKILRGSCEAVGTILTLPCKACGIATESLTDLCRSPFCLYLTVALGLNIPPMIFTGKSVGVAYEGEGCSSAANWMYVNGALCFVNIAAALYIAAKITHEPKEDSNEAPFVEASVMNHETKQPPAEQKKKSIFDKVMENTLDSSHTRAKSMSRVKDILCYDPVVAVYIIIGIFYMVWQTMGISRRLQASDCGIEDYVSNSLMCGFMFIFFGGMTFSISLCCLGRSR